MTNFAAVVFVVTMIINLFTSSHVSWWIVVASGLLGAYVGLHKAINNLFESG